MVDAFHYPPEILKMLIDTVPLLCRSKKDVISFFQGAGVEPGDLAEVSIAVRNNPASITKFDIVRNVLTKVNIRGDSGLGPRREILQRVVDFESFETCWENDQYKAKGLVATIREAVNRKDSFTRMRQERDAERQQVLAQQNAERAIASAKRAKLEDVSKRLSKLFAMDDKPQTRGKFLEEILNDLFSAYGILIREDFRRRDPDTSTILEQIDGVIELDGIIHLVEMKWLATPVGIGEFSAHLSRLFIRANANGIFIAANGYSSAVVSECRTALSQKTLFLCSLHEFVMLLQRQDDLVAFLKRKSQAAIIDKNPFLEIL